MLLLYLNESFRLTFQNIFVILYSRREVKKMTKTESLGKRIQALRKERNMTQEELADKIGPVGTDREVLTQSAISKMENEKNESVYWEVLLRLANVFQMPGLEIVKGTSREESIRCDYLFPRFCANHDPAYIIPRLQNRFENRFCYDCGQELRGDCQHCSTPIEVLSVEGGFCHVCGKHFDPFWVDGDPKYEDLSEKYAGDGFFSIVPNMGEYIGPACLCLAPHEFDDQARNLLEGNHSGIKEDETIRGLVFPKFSFTGEVKYCPECGQETIDACPRCGRPILKPVAGHILKFCAGCGLNFREFHPEADVGVPEQKSSGRTRRKS